MRKCDILHSVYFLIRAKTVFTQSLAEMSLGETAIPEAKWTTLDAEREANRCIIAGEQSHLSVYHPLAILSILFVSISLSRELFSSFYTFAAGHRSALLDPRSLSAISTLLSDLAHYLLCSLIFIHGDSLRNGIDCSTTACYCSNVIVGQLIRQ